MRLLRCGLYYSLALALFGVASGCGFDQPPALGLGGGSSSIPARTLVFEPNSALQLDPGKSAILAVRLTPPRAQSIRFGIVGDAVNSAYLLNETVVTDADGRAFVTLFAPSIPGMFRVRAATEVAANEDDAAEDDTELDSLSAERAVVVGASGFGAVVITLENAADFAVSEWHASAFPGQTCAALGTQVNPGSIKTTGPAPLLLADLPAGGPLALVVSGGLIARGCATLPSLNRDEVKPVTVVLEALPFDIQGGLDLELSLESVSELFTEKLNSFVEAEFSQQSAQVLLDTMKKLVPESERSTFAATTKAAGLNELLESHLEERGGLAEIFSTELTELAATLPGRPGLVGHLDFNANPISFGAVNCSGVPAKTVLAKNPMALSFTVDFDGRFVSSSLLRLAPLAWLRELAYLEASESDVSVAAHLAHNANCSELAAEASLAFPLGEAYPECGPSCFAELCADSLEKLWKTMGSNSPTLTLDLAQSGVLLRDDEGKLTGITGEFLAVEGGGPMLEGSIRGRDGAPE